MADPMMPNPTMPTVLSAVGWVLGDADSFFLEAEVATVVS
jgi:hypothetical protein